MRRFCEIVAWLGKLLNEGEAAVTGEVFNLE